MTGVRHPHPAHGSGWHVLTGGPSSGTTTTVTLLHARGYATTIEHARHYIDLQRISGRSIRQIRDRQAQFQRAVGFGRGPVHQIGVVLGLGLQIDHRALGLAEDVLFPVQQLLLEIGLLPFVHERLVVGRAIWA